MYTFYGIAFGNKYVVVDYNENKQRAKNNMISKRSQRLFHYENKNNNEK